MVIVIEIEAGPLWGRFFTLRRVKINYQLNNHKKIRVNTTMWNDFRSVCDLNNTTASVELRNHMEQYISKNKPQKFTVNNK